MDTHLYQSAVGVLAMSRRDTFGDDTTARVLADMNHLRTGICLLVVIRNCNGVELGGRVIALEDTRRIFPGNRRARLHLRPGKPCVLVRDTAFGNEIIDTAFPVLVARIPVLHGGVLDFTILMHNDLDNGCMQLVLVPHRRCAAL